MGEEFANLNTLICVSEHLEQARLLAENLKSQNHNSAFNTPPDLASFSFGSFIPSFPTSTDMGHVNEFYPFISTGYSQVEEVKREEEEPSTNGEALRKSCVVKRSKDDKANVKDKRRKRAYYKRNQHPEEFLRRVDAERLVKKRAKNRELAAKSRLRKKEKMKELEDDNNALAKELQNLRDQLNKCTCGASRRCPH